MAEDAASVLMNKVRGRFHELENAFTGEQVPEEYEEELKKMCQGLWDRIIRPTIVRKSEEQKLRDWLKEHPDIFIPVIQTTGTDPGKGAMIIRSKGNPYDEVTTTPELLVKAARGVLDG